MDEAGAADKIDSAAGLHWPMEHGALAAAGCLNNGANCDSNIVLNQHRGVGIFGTPAVTINQATSTGLSAWFWLKLVAYGAGASGWFLLDTDDVLHTNRFRLLFGFADALTGSMEVGHTNDTDDVFADTPNLAWALGTCHMVAITYDKTAHTLNVYVDGVISATVADPFVYPDLTNADLELANTTPPGTGSAFVVDECGLSTKGALTPAQVTALWNGGNVVPWPTVTTIVPYP